MHILYRAIVRNAETYIRVKLRSSELLMTNLKIMKCDAV
jgi:hypothetical protein